MLLIITNENILQTRLSDGCKFNPTLYRQWNGFTVVFSKQKIYALNSKETKESDVSDICRLMENLNCFENVIWENH